MSLSTLRASAWRRNTIRLELIPPPRTQPLTPIYDPVEEKRKRREEEKEENAMWRRLCPGLIIKSDDERSSCSSSSDEADSDNDVSGVVSIPIRPTESDEDSGAEWANPPSLVASSEDGILAMTDVDSKEETMLVLCFNLFTRCQIGRVSLPSNLGSLQSMHFVDSNTLLLIGSSSQFRYFSLASTKYLTALTLTSTDGFRNITCSPTANVFVVGRQLRPGENPNDADVIIRMSAVEYVEGTVEVGDGFVVLLRQGVEGDADGLVSYKLRYVGFRDLCNEIAAAAELCEQPRMRQSLEQGENLATEVGWFKLLKAARIDFIPYDSTSFAVLQGDSGNNRIDIYDIRSKSFTRSIPVNWPLTTNFPSVVALPLPSGAALLQSVIGEKVMLDLTSGDAQLCAPFIDPSLSPNKDNLGITYWLAYEKLSQTEMRVAGYSNYNENSMEFSDDFMIEVENLVKLKDLVYLVTGSTTVDGSIIGCYADTMNTERDTDKCLARTMTRLRLERVHSLAELASDAIIERLSREDRMRITSMVNPTRTVDFIRAILQQL